MASIDDLAATTELYDNYRHSNRGGSSQSLNSTLEYDRGSADGDSSLSSMSSLVLPNIIEATFHQTLCCHSSIRIHNQQSVERFAAQDQESDPCENTGTSESEDTRPQANTSTIERHCRNENMLRTPTSLVNSESTQTDVSFSTPLSKLVVDNTSGISAQTSLTIDDSGHQSTESMLISYSTPGFADCWARLVGRAHTPIRNTLRAVAMKSATYPNYTVGFISFLTFLLLGTGLMTNFNVNVDDQQLWTPVHTLPNLHSQWIFNKSQSGFKGGKRWITMLFHDNGNNVLSVTRMRKVFTVLETLRQKTNLTMACNDGSSPFLELSSSGCSIYGPTSFWENSLTTFENKLTNDRDMRQYMSSPLLPEGVPVIDSQILGMSERKNGQLISAQSMILTMTFLHTDDSLLWEKEASDTILDLREKWAADYPFKTEGLLIEMQAKRSMGSEFKRAIADDIPLVPIVFVAMALFTAFVFSRKNTIQSRSTLGIGAVVTVLLSICSGFGLLFIIGVPFTSITQILPFIIFGIGLDDAFVLSGSYNRTDPKRTPVERICDSIDDIGLSITLTTITSVTAFSLGCISSVPAVRWLCLYAFPTILFVFIYQLTFFVALIALDERRIQAKRRDPLLCCFECKSWKSMERFTMDDAMECYGRFLLKPPVRLMVVCGFATLLGFGIHSALSLTQKFEITDVLPEDSFVTEFLRKGKEYRGVGPLSVGVYFRDCDQSDPAIRAEMQIYIDELLQTEYFNEQPDYFWLRYFNIFTTSPGIAPLPFNQQMVQFLNHSIFGELFRNDISIDDSGNVVASRVFMRMTVDLGSINDQVSALHAQRKVSENQAINQGRERFAFFTYEGSYKMTEFFSVATKELIFTTISGVISVSLATMAFVPHWSAFLFVFPLISILYVELLGVMQWAGLHVNAVSYVSMAMSIGILVDFLMHVLFRYFECSGNRGERTIEMLRTMGSSILLGALSTFLGTIPLMFCSSDIFETVFYCFFGIVTLGVGHGLILLPVLLATFGPEPLSPSLAPAMFRTASNRSSDTFLTDHDKTKLAVSTAKLACKNPSIIVFIDPENGMISM